MDCVPYGKIFVRSGSVGDEKYECSQDRNSAEQHFFSVYCTFQMHTTIQKDGLVNLLITIL